MFHVLLDPGHGGEDPGATSTFDRPYTEKNQNLLIARQVKINLENQGVKVYMTREEGEGMTPGWRVRLQKVILPDCFVSIHCNAFAKATARGIEVFYHDKRDARLAGEVYHSLLNELELPGRGVKRDVDWMPYALKVLTFPAVRSCLVEVGFITNPEDVKVFSQHERTGSAIARGVFSWLTMQEG